VPTGRRTLRTLARSAVLVPVVLIALQKAALAAEVIITPAASASPSKDFGGWTFKMAIASMSLSALIILLLAAAYLRYAPRFYAGEGGGAPPLRPQARPGAAAAVALDAPPLPSPAAPAAPAAAAADASATEATAAPAPPAAAPAAPPDDAPAPAAAAPAAPAPPAAAPAARPAPAPREEGPLEQDPETYDRVLAEELGKGTDRRVAEGRAKSAAIRAARRKASGG